MNLLKAVAAATLVTTLLAPAQAQDSEVVEFGIIPTESSENLQTLWDPFIVAMKEATGLEIKPFFASDYAGIIEAMRFEKVDVAWYGNKSAMEAVDRADAEIFAQTVSVEGNPGYWSVLITQADNSLENLEQLLACDSSLDFGIGDPNSTSGFLVPMTFIFAKNEVVPQECFATVRNASHETNAMAVANGQVDVATNNTESLTRLEATHPEARQKIKVIWQSPLIPADPIAWRAGLDEDTKRKLMTFFMSYGRQGAPEEVAEAREILSRLDWAPFRPSSNAQLYPIRIMELTKNISLIDADENLSAEEKEERIAALREEVARYRNLLETAPQT